MTATIIPFPKKNQRIPIDDFKKGFIFCQENNLDTTSLSVDGTSIVAISVMELLENLGYDTKKADMFIHLALALESLKSYILAYSGNNHPIQKISKSIFSIKDGIIYLNQGHINEIYRNINRGNNDTN